MASHIWRCQNRFGQVSVHDASDDEGLLSWIQLDCVGLRWVRPLQTGHFARKDFGHFGHFQVNLLLVQLCCLLLRSTLAVASENWLLFWYNLKILTEFLSRSLAEAGALVHSSLMVNSFVSSEFILN